MNVSLTPELERAVAELVETGRYRSASEVVREALRLLHDREEAREAKLAALRKAVDVGIEELERGEGLFADQSSGIRSQIGATRAGMPPIPREWRSSVPDPQQTILASSSRSPDGAAGSAVPRPGQTLHARADPGIAASFQCSGPANCARGGRA